MQRRTKSNFTCLKTHLTTRWVQWPAYAANLAQPKQYLAGLAFVNGKCRVSAMIRQKKTRLELQAAVMELKLKEEIVKELEMKIQSCSF